MASSDTRAGYLYVLGAGTLWGSFAAIAKLSYALKAPVMVVAWFRPSLAFLIILIILLARKKVYLKVEARDLPFLVVFGLVGVTLFNLFFLYTIDISTIVMAVFLLYSAPIFVTIISRLVFGELLTGLKLAALACSLVGLALLVQVYDLSQLKVSVLGLLTGLGAGLTYALFSIFGKALVRRYSHWTILLYTMGFGAFFLSFFALPQLNNLPFTLGVWSLLITMALVHTLAAYSLYVRGLKSIEASRASILTTVEPVVASVLGLSFFGEVLGPVQALGGGLVILGAILAQVRG